MAVRRSVYSLQQDAIMSGTEQVVKGTSPSEQKKRTTCPHAIERKWQKCLEGVLCKFMEELCSPQTREVTLTV